MGGEGRNGKMELGYVDFLPGEENRMKMGIELGQVDCASIVWRVGKAAEIRC